MSKIICDICGTTYPDTADSCPICGCSRDAAAEFLGDDFMSETMYDEPRGKGGHYTAKKKKEIFDFDEVNADPVEEPVVEEDPYEEEEETYEEGKNHNVFVVILLTVLIVALLLAAGFIFVKYFLPNMADDEPVPTTAAAATEVQVPETTELSIPCKILMLTSGTPELTKEGQNFLLHVQTTPADTTDKIYYASEDESIATVTEDGKITAISEGETVINITCGNIQATCPVIVRFVEETVSPTEATAPETIAETVPETTAATEAAPASNVTLKLKQTDIRLGVYYQYQLKLDCDLEQNEVQWRSEHEHIATVDENGVVTAKKDGTTAIIATYGDQEVSCIVRCIY